MLPGLHSLAAPMQQHAAGGGGAFFQPQPQPMGPPVGMQPQAVHYMQPAHGMAFASPTGVLPACKVVISSDVLSMIGLADVWLARHHRVILL